MLLSNMKVPLLFKKLKAVSNCVCIWYRGSFYLTCVTLQIFSSTVIPRVLSPPPPSPPSKQTACNPGSQSRFSLFPCSVVLYCFLLLYCLLILSMERIME
jgi:hypothetical protein